MRVVYRYRQPVECGLEIAEDVFAGNAFMLRDVAQDRAESPNLYGIVRGNDLSGTKGVLVLSMM